MNNEPNRNKIQDAAQTLHHELLTTTSALLVIESVVRSAVSSRTYLNDSTVAGQFLLELALDNVKSAVKGLPDDSGYDADQADELVERLHALTDYWNVLSFEIGYDCLSKSLITAMSEFIVETIQMCGDVASDLHRTFGISDSAVRTMNRLQQDRE